MNVEPRPNRWLWIAGLLLLGGTALGANWFLNSSTGSDGASAQDKDLPPPSTICIGIVDIEPGVAKLYPVQPGGVIEIITEGKEVKKDEVLLKMDDRLAKWKLDEALADLGNAKSLLDTANQFPKKLESMRKQQQFLVAGTKHQREAARFEYKTKEELAIEARGAINESIKKAYEEIVKGFDERVKGEEEKLKELDLLDPQIEINRAQSNVNAKQAVVDMAKLAVEECELKAPSDGTVLRVFVRMGESLGSNPKAPAIEFAPKGPKIVRAEVLQEWARYVKEGQEVSIADDTFVGDKWTGKVKSVAKYLTQKQQVIFEPYMLNDVRTLQCVVEVTSEGPQPLRIGQRVRVTIKNANP
ncbi:MAG: HlyD family efflux transporter periplasmic adaptor subunit [Gemmataceae bacterium]|nr:HlyD family efflux transporter periplasmic adaptor subunit [Gemmataceae bacterium]MCI0743433.1 HlyD family efflux transporter periplasmic adaptor subunit [Gemmataceae bacterium]